MKKNFAFTEVILSTFVVKDGVDKKTYTQPCLEQLGDLRTVTLGGSPITGDDSFGGPYL